MEVKKIVFKNDLKSFQGIENEKIHVVVEVKNGNQYIVVLATLRNMEYLMEKEKINYYPPGCPVIIVNELTEDAIYDAVIAYAEKNGGYWLKFYHFAEDIKKTMFDELKAELLTAAEPFVKSGKSFAEYLAAVENAEEWDESN